MKYLNIQNIIIVASILALIILAVFLFKIISCSDSIEYIPEDFFESNKPLQNPYCGFYHIIRYTLSDEYTPLDSFDHEISEYTQSLVLLEINLKNYRTTEISKKGIEQLNCILSAWSKSETGTKLIIRFLYDWDGLALATEPDSIELILKHMEQVCQAVNKYSDIVYIMQGAFIGNWGEMHHSEFSDPNSVKMLINRLNELANPEIYLSVRTPYLWRLVNNMYELPENLQTFEVDNTCITARLGLFNDGILGSETDLGTYGNTLKKDALSPAYHGVRTEELKFQNKLCIYVPNGGEVVYNNNLCELENAVSTLKEMHVSYLNADYDSAVFDKWKNTVWTKKDCFYGCDGYSYIKAHLGYRYLIKSSKIKKSGLFRRGFVKQLF